MRAAILQLCAGAILFAVQPANAAPSCDVLPIQVWLDRQGFSPGVLDGKLGGNTTRALAAYREAKERRPGQPAHACPSLEEFPEASGFAATIQYQVTADDAAGPFAPVPDEIADQAGLPALGYESLVEKLAEKFHATPALLESLNKGTAIAPGASIIVPNVEPFDPQAKPPRARAAKLSIEVTREGELRVRDADGSTVFYAPTSSGSEHDPLPPGQWKVTGVHWMPPFHYNPDLFWDAEATDSKARIAPGPNNPVGVVWIDIDMKHYGLHGTPEPSRIGYTQSHGCVRLTNWDAAKLASFVAAGTPVHFR
jgi:lipoprotein-anchoring transpeptidase ErfK/SrfK